MTGLTSRRASRTPTILGLVAALLLSLPGTARGVGRPTTLPARGVGVEAAVPVRDAAPAGNAGLFVGVNEFKELSGLQPLRFAVDDAVAQAHLFVVELKLVPPANCFLCLGGAPAGDAAKAQLKALDAAGAKKMDGARATILYALVAAGQLPADKADLLVVSFSTHGFEDRGVPYAMPADGLRGLLRQTAVDLLDVEQQLAQTKAGKRLLIVDACREKALAGGRGDDPPMTDKFRKSLEAAEGQAVLASCDAGQVSFENAELGHGVFTHFLLEGLRGRAAADADGFIRLGAVGDYVARSVGDWAVRNKPGVVRSTAQKPWFKGPLEARDMPLAIDPKAKLAMESFKGEAARVADALRVRIDRRGPFTTARYERLADVLESLHAADPQGQQLLKAAADFADGRLAPEVAVAYFDSIVQKYQVNAPDLIAAPPATANAPVVTTAPSTAVSTVPSVTVKPPPDRPSPATAVPPNWNAKELLLYEIPGTVKVADTVAAPDGRRVGCIETWANGRCVAINDKRTKAHDWVVGHSLGFSTDGSRFTYQTQHDGLIFVAVGPTDDPVAAVEGKGYFLAGPVLLSPDGKRTAYQALRGKGEKPVMVVDGSDVGPYDVIDDRHTAFSPDGKHLAFHVTVGGKEAFVIDGAQGKAYDKVLGLTFGGDGARVGYRAMDGDQKFMVIDGREGPRYDMVAGLRFTADGRKAAYAAGKGDKQMLVVDDGPPGKPNLRAFKAYDGLGDVAFSPDGRRLGITVFMAGHATGDGGGRWRAVLDGIEGSDFSGLGPLVFSADNRHVAYVAGRDGKQVAVVDGVAGPLLDGVGVFVFSPEGGRFAYAAQQGKERWVMVDHKPLAPAGLFAFSPDGRHLCHAVPRPGDRWALAVDGKTVSNDFDGFPLNARLLWDSFGSARVVVGRGLKLFLVELYPSSPSP